MDYAKQGSAQRERLVCCAAGRSHTACVVPWLHRCMDTRMTLLYLQILTPWLPFSPLYSPMEGGLASGCRVECQAAHAPQACACNSWRLTLSGRQGQPATLGCECGLGLYTGVAEGPHQACMPSLVHVYEPGPTPPTGGAPCALVLPVYRTCPVDTAHTVKLHTLPEVLQCCWGRGLSRQRMQSRPEAPPRHLGATVAGELPWLRLLTTSLAKPTGAHCVHCIVLPCMM